MEEIRGTIESLVLVSDHLEHPVELELMGEALGDVTIGAGVTFILTGSVHGDVIALEGSIVEINGFVGGKVMNHGASVFIKGSIGLLLDSNSSPAEIAPEAHIRNC